MCIRDRYTSVKNWYSTSTGDNGLQSGKEISIDGSGSYEMCIRDREKAEEPEQKGTGSTDELTGGMNVVKDTEPEKAAVNKNAPKAMPCLLYTSLYYLYRLEGHETMECTIGLVVPQEPEDGVDVYKRQAMYIWRIMSCHSGD